MNRRSFANDFKAWRKDAGAWLREHGFELWIITGIWAVLSVVIYLLAVGHESPRRYQDEFLFWALAKNFAAGDGLTWRGVGLNMKSWLYPVLLSPAFWLSNSVPTAYTLVHLLNSLMISATVFPAFLMARLYLGRWTALLAAIFAVSVPAMNYAGIIGTESLGYLTCTAAFAAILLATGRPRPRNTLLAFVTIFFAALTRTQFVILLPIYFAVVLLAGLLRGSGAKAYLRSQRWPLGIMLGLFALGGLALLVQGRGAVGIYGGVFDGVPLTWEAMKFWIKSFSADVYLLAAIAPVIATFAMLGSSENRRDPLVGALLALALVATVAFVLQVSWFSATNPYDWRNRHIFYERYMFYLGPIFFTGLLVAWKRVSTSMAVISGSIAVVIVSGFNEDAVLVPFSYDSFGLSLVGKYMQEFAIEHPETAIEIGRKLATVTLLVAVVYAISTIKREVVAKIAYATVVVFSLFALIKGQWQTWDYARTFSGQAFAQVPKPADFVDENTDKDVGMIVTSTDSPEMYFTTEFWNDRITRAFATDTAPIKSPIMYSPTCQFDWEPDGQIVGTGCSVIPDVWYMRSDNVVMHLKDEIKRVHPANFPNITLMEGELPPRILSIVDGRDVRTGITQGNINARTFLDRRGTLRVKVGVNAESVLVKVGDAPARTVPKGKARTLDVAVPIEDHVTPITITTGAGQPTPALIEQIEVRQGRGDWESIL